MGDQSGALHAMRFQVLGSLRLWTGSSWAGIQGARPRTLLSLLLIRIGQPVSTGHLIAELWPHDPPTSAAAQVRGSVLQLRRALGDQAIVTRSGGYELSCTADALDATSFAALTAQGRSALAVGAAEEAQRLLSHALTLWRGEPYSDAVATPAIATEVRRLTEQRLTAAEGRIEASLLLGRWNEITPELQGLAREHPLREGLWAQLMRALYAAGRRADALQAYRQARTVLTEELGLEPGPDLQDLHQVILKGRPLPEDGGTVHGSPPTDDRSPLPRDTTAFTGRRQNLIQLRHLLTDSQRPDVVVITGAGGVGKSTLAIHLAHRMREDFPDGQLYVDLQGSSEGRRPLVPVEVLGRMLRALGVDPRRVPSDVAEARARFSAMTTNRRMLVLLDNAVSGCQIQPLLPGHGSATLVTSRRSLTSVDCTCHHLGALSAPEARALLGALIGAERIAAEPEATRQITRLCGGLPLALRIAGARLAARPHWPLSWLAHKLTGEQHRLDELEIDDLAVRASFAVSYRDLESDHDGREKSRLFGLLGLLEWPDITAPITAALIGGDRDKAEGLLAQLLDSRLLESPEPGRYRVHDLMHLYAREQAEHRISRDEQQAALRRVIASYTSAAMRVTDLLTPLNAKWLTEAEKAAISPNSEIRHLTGAIEWLDAHRANAVTATRQAAALPGSAARDAILLAGTLSGPFVVHGHWQDFSTVNEIALEVAQRLGDAAAEARARMYLCYAHGLQGRVAEILPHLERAHAIWQELGDAYGEARTTGGFGTLLMHQGRYDEAVAHFERARSTYLEVGEHHDEVLLLFLLGTLHRMTREDDKALAFLGDALGIARRIGYRHGEYYISAGLAEIHALAGDLDAAVRHYQYALPFAQAVGDRSGQARVHWQLFIAFRDLDEPATARTHLHQALEILKHMGALTAEQVEALRDDPDPGLPEYLDHDRRWAIVNADARLPQ